MKKFSYLLLAVLSIVSFNTSLFAQTETRSLTSFNALKLNGFADITLTSGSNESIKLEVENIDLSDILTSVKNNTLYIDLKKQNRNTYNNVKIKLFITYRQLSSISSEGAINLKTSSPIKSNQFTVDFSGAGSFDLQVETEKLTIDSSGAGNIEISGKANTQQINLSGAGNVSAFDLVSNKANVEVNGVGNIQVNVQQELIAELNGMGNISYKGNPSSKQINKSGFGSIKKVN